nr:hypothetical protein A5482_09780 [Cyanobacterium sp. IPPAS B-1200]
MNNNLGKYLAVGSLAIGGAFLSANAVQAAALVGEVSVGPLTNVTGITEIGGVSGFSGGAGVSLPYIGVEAPDPNTSILNPLTGFTFSPASSSPSGFGSATQISFVPTGSDFNPFLNAIGLIRDIDSTTATNFAQKAQGTPGFEGFSVPAFLQIFDQTSPGVHNDLLYSFDLESIALPQYSTPDGNQNTPSTVITLGFSGIFNNAADGSQSAGTFTSTLIFNNSSPNTIRDNIRNAAGGGLFISNWQANANAATVPEPSAVGGLMVFGLLGSVVALKKRKEKVLN